MYSFLTDDNHEHIQAKDVLLNNKCIRHSMNRTQSKDHRIWTYQINKISLINIQSNGCDQLALGYQSWL